jgi:hypothetical protein
LPEKSGFVKGHSTDKFPAGRQGAKPASLWLFVGFPFQSNGLSEAVPKPAGLWNKLVILLFSIYFKMTGGSLLV